MTPERARDAADLLGKLDPAEWAKLYGRDLADAALLFTQQVARGDNFRDVAYQAMQALARLTKAVLAYVAKESSRRKLSREATAAIGSFAALKTLFTVAGYARDREDFRARVAAAAQAKGDDLDPADVLRDIVN